MGGKIRVLLDIKDQILRYGFKGYIVLYVCVCIMTEEIYMNIILSLKSHHESEILAEPKVLWRSSLENEHFKKTVTLTCPHHADCSSEGEGRAGDGA